MAGKHKPAPPKRTGLIAFRLPPDMEDDVRADMADLDVDLSTWFRAAARMKLDSRVTDDLRAIREVVEYAARRGVTGEMLAAAARLLP